RLARLKRHAPITGCTCHLENEEVTRDTATAIAILYGGRGYVVCRQNGARRNSNFLRHFGSHLEVHDVSDIITVHEEHAFSAGGRLGTFKDWGRRRGRKDIAD